MSIGLANSMMVSWPMMEGLMIVYMHILECSERTDLMICQVVCSMAFHDVLYYSTVFRLLLYDLFVMSWLCHDQ